MAICGCGLPVRCCQPAVAEGVIYADLWGEFNTHLALQALFTQSSPVRKPLLQAFPFPSTLGRWHCTRFLRPASLFTAQVGSWSSPLSCGVFFPPLLLQAFPLLIAAHVLLLLPASMFVYSSHGKWVFPLSCGVFLPPPLSQAFLLLVAGRMPPLPPEHLQPGPACLLTVLGSIPLPCFLALRAPHPLCNVSLLFLLLFFPWGVVGLSRGLCCSGPGLSVGVTRTANLTLSASSQAVWAQAAGSPGALLVSPFNVKPGGGVEGSTFFLFSVVLPARCVSSVSPRFHYRKHAFCSSL
jgi:hypothetical protein